MRNGIKKINSSNRGIQQQHEREAYLKDQRIISTSPSPTSPFLPPKHNRVSPAPSMASASFDPKAIHRRSSSDVGDNTSTRNNIEIGKATNPKNGAKKGSRLNILVGNNITHNHACIEKSFSSQSLAGADWSALSFPANCCMNANETILLSKSGEILVSRCRNAILHQVVVGGSSELIVQSMTSFDGDCAVEEDENIMEPLHYASSSPCKDNCKENPVQCCATAANFAVATVEALSNFGSWEQRNDSDGRSLTRPVQFESVPEGAIMNQSKEEGAIEMEKQSGHKSIQHSRRKKRDLSLSPTASCSSMSAGESAGKERLSPVLSDSNRGVSECKGEQGEYLMDLIEEDDVPEIPDITQSQSFDSQNPGDILVDMQQRDIPLPSFDYSCYSSTTEVNRIPSPQRTYSTSEVEVVVHGIPRFLKALSQVRITKISANPLGGHVLLISKDGILFSYGRNDHGQLGNGRKSCMFQMTPTIITPLLENGGKAIECAAGVTHSLVVVKTDGLRVGRLCESSISSISQPEKIVRVFSAPSGDVNNRLCVHPSSSGTMEHHQIYSFGQNDFMKLGLLKPSFDVEDELLPRRVAMHCKVWVEDEASSDFGNKPLVLEPNSSPRLGIFKIVASLHHSAALIRRSSNAIEAYTWGKADDGALGHMQNNKPFIHVPTLVETLSHGDESRLSASSNSPNSSTHGNHPNPCVYRTLSDISDASHNELELPDYPVDIALGPSSSIVLTAKGRCFSFGKSDDGMLGLGENTSTALAPTQISFTETPIEDQPHITSLSVGARHAVCVTKTGRIYSWGIMDNGRLGIASLESKIASDTTLPSYVMPNAPKPRIEPTSPNNIVWQPLLIPYSDLVANDLDQTLFHNHHIPRRNGIHNNSSSNDDDNLIDDSNLGVRVCAGIDSTIFLMRSGAVLSCGKESGRLGQSTVSSDIFSPKPLFGGLKLWQRQEMLLTKEISRS